MSRQTATKPRNETSSRLIQLDWEQIAQQVWAEAHGLASTATTAALASDPARWENVLLDLLEKTDESLQSLRQLPRHQRRQVVADFQDDQQDLTAAYVRLTGHPPSPPVQPDGVTGRAGARENGTTNGQADARTDTQTDSGNIASSSSVSLGPVEPCALQLSWSTGQANSTGQTGRQANSTGQTGRQTNSNEQTSRQAGGQAGRQTNSNEQTGGVVAWLAGANSEPDSTDAVLERLATTGAIEGAWVPHKPIRLPSGSAAIATSAEAVAADLTDVLGWLVALDAPDLLGDSAVWLRTVCLAAVDMVAKGRTVPLLHRVRGPRSKKKPDTGEFQVRWQPAVLASDTLAQLTDSLPLAVLAASPDINPKDLVAEILTATANALMGSVAARIDVPQPPHEPRTKAEMIEAYLAGLDGTHFTGSASVGSELARRLELWARPVTTPTRHSLIVHLDEPDEAGAWHMSVFSPGSANSLDPVEVALVVGANTRRTDVKAQLARLERLLPVLLRPGGRRRGEVVLNQAEAWDLMSVTGPMLEAAGFEVRLPALSRDRPAPSLRITAEDAPDSLLGAQHLTAVTWTAMFGDDIELTAEQVRELAAQARPMVRTRGKWVALDRTDLAEAAAALAERADDTRLTGAQMLRQALGLEGSTLAGGVSISDGSWAADLLRAAAAVPVDPPTHSDGFVGELRHYQAEALAWLDFLDEAGLGGCLALDMGLGKTPTMLARVALAQANEPTLVIAPPAVVSNWANETARFTPDLEVLVHHGPSRAALSELPAKVADADLVITTYGTAVRDIDTLAQLEWHQVIVDEAQVIKNHNSETARQLRKLQARTRIALTGTPIENGLADLWSISDFCNPGLVGERSQFIAQLSQAPSGATATESALHTLNGVLVFRRTKVEPSIAAELPDRIDDLDDCAMTPEQIGLYQAVLDQLIVDTAASEQNLTVRKGTVLAAITALKQICNHPLNYRPDDPDQSIEGRSGKLARLEEILEVVFAAGERVLIFTHFATWGNRLATYLAKRWEMDIECYHGGLSRGPRDEIVQRFQEGSGPGAMVLSLKAGGTGLNLTAASHVVLYDRWWNPAVEDQARDRAWRIGQTKTVICHRLVCPGTVDQRVEEVVAGKRRIADMVLPKSSSLGDLNAEQLRVALGINEDLLSVPEESG